MAKMKTHRGAAKRFSKTGSGKWKRNNAFGRHILTKKSAKRKRNIRGGEMVHASDVAAINRLVPYK